ncbi:MAG: hypothetical protein P9L92_19355 [Candidatus Electryonea clarkiae]|nr:hypothetical protein [Candidatus Electryonea clarkiae]MDP8285211.1 hypothetical protein [Candidatus Electryonea clarkiae]
MILRFSPFITKVFHPTINLHLSRFSTILICLLICNGMYAQVGEVAELVSPERKKLMILPVQLYSTDDYDIKEEMTTIISDIAVNLGRYDVIDRNNLEAILSEQALHLTGIINDSMVVEIGKIAAANEGLLIDVIEFSQKGVPPDDATDEESIIFSIFAGIFAGLFNFISGEEGEKIELWSNNIHTELSVSIKKVNVETGETIKSVIINKEHTGGNSGKSKSNVVEKFTKKAAIELKNFYLLSATVSLTDDNEIFIPAGSNVGVKKGTLFEITGNDRELNVKGKKFSRPGERVGFLEAKEVFDEGIIARDVRTWKPVKSGYRAVEFHRPQAAGQFYYMKSNEKWWGTGFDVEIVPFSRYNFWFGFSFLRGEDTRGDTDTGFGVELGPGVRLYNRQSFALKMYPGIGAAFFFKKDDRDKFVSTASFLSSIAIGAELYKSAGTDITLKVGYRNDTGSNNWNNYGDEEDDEPDYAGQWSGESPEIDITGYFISIGFKFTNLKDLY